MGWIRKGWLAVLLLTASCVIGDTNILINTNSLDDGVFISMSFKNVPLELFADRFAEITGKAVVVDKGIRALLSLTTGDEPINKAQGIVLMEKALEDAGLEIVPSGTNTLRIIRSKKEDTEFEIVPTGTNRTALVLVNITQEPFAFKFNSKSEIPIGTNIHGFVVVGFTPKFQKMQNSSGADITVDVSELTLKRGDRTITISRGETTPFLESTAHFIDKAENKDISMQTGDDVSVGGHKLRLLEVNVTEFRCKLEDVKSGEQFTIKRMVQPTVPR
jgi:hypothetical protein